MNKVLIYNTSTVIYKVGYVCHNNDKIKVCPISKITEKRVIRANERANCVNVIPANAREAGLNTCGKVSKSYIVIIK